MKKKLIGVWDVVKSVQLYMYSAEKQELDEAINILTSTLKEFSVNIHADLVTVIRSQKKESVIDKLEEKYQGLTKIAVRGDKLHVATVDYLVSHIKAEIDNYIDLHQCVKEFMEVQNSRYLYFMKFKRQEFIEIERQYSRCGVTISSINGNRKKGFEVSGKKDFCKEAIQKLGQIIANISQSEITLDWAGLADFLRSEEGNYALQHIELTDSCVLKVHTVSANEERTAALELTECTNMQTENYVMGNCTIAYVTGDILKTDVDVIVNPSFRTLINTIGLGQAIFQKGKFLNVKLETFYMLSVFMCIYKF